MSGENVWRKCPAINYAVTKCQKFWIQIWIRNALEFNGSRLSESCVNLPGLIIIDGILVRVVPFPTVSGLSPFCKGISSGSKIESIKKFSHH